jgi:hypothetical protein
MKSSPFATASIFLCGAFLPSCEVLEVASFANPIGVAMLPGMAIGSAVNASQKAEGDRMLNEANQIRQQKLAEVGMTEAEAQVYQAECMAEYQRTGKIVETPRKWANRLSPKSKTSHSKSAAKKTSGNHPLAISAPGKAGFVFSPYSNKMVDVSGIPTGTLVQDPTAPAPSPKYFRVP